MAAQADVTPNRRGRRSREAVLDAAERVMASDGFDAATVARVVREAGVPMSSVYHYYGSKDGILLAVMERGAKRFFADLPDPEHRTGRSAEHLRTVVSSALETLQRHPSFLRLMVVFAVQPPSAADGEVRTVVGRVREMALKRLRRQIGIAFGDDPSSSATDRLARFALAAFDGAFVAWQADPEIRLERTLEPLAPALVAARGRKPNARS